MTNYRVLVITIRTRYPEIMSAVFGVPFSFPIYIFVEQAREFCGKGCGRGRRGSELGLTKKKGTRAFWQLYTR